MSKEQRLTTNEELEAILDETFGHDDDADEDADPRSKAETSAETPDEAIRKLEAKVKRLRSELDGEFSAATLAELQQTRARLEDAKRCAIKEKEAFEGYWRNRMSGTFVSREEYERDWVSKYRDEALKEYASRDEETRRAAKHLIYKNF